MTSAEPAIVGATGETVWTIVVAGGSGNRFGRPKQYESLGVERVLDRSVRVAAGASAGVVVVVPAGDVAGESRACAADVVVAGGASRAASVRAGLDVVPDGATVVCVHDAARPFATPGLYSAVVDAVVAGADGAIPGVVVTDTIKVVDAEGVVVSTPSRDALRAVQTPQAFRAETLRRAHASGRDGTDDASLVEAIGGRVVVVPGEADNRKITHPADLDWARQVVAGQDRAATGESG
ncbi:MAG: 2-C-methyl-D-erythritol 4-phosphate cytidylyltransferase [Acidimicrobiales bacterium]|nr:2-C-methyl-D-erythritol 4-phosphate cytidylyltransferase [Acidimicrobiales bacterium]